MTPLQERPFIVGFKEIDKGARDVLLLGGREQALQTLGMSRV